MVVGETHHFWKHPFTSNLRIIRSSAVPFPQILRLWRHVATFLQPQCLGKRHRVSKQRSGEKNNYGRKNMKKTVVLYPVFFKLHISPVKSWKTCEFDEIVHCHLQVYIIAIETMSARAKLSGELSPSAAWLDRSGFPGANCTAMLRRRQSC